MSLKAISQIVSSQSTFREGVIFLEVSLIYFVAERFTLDKRRF